MSVPDEPQPAGPSWTEQQVADLLDMKAEGCRYDVIAARCAHTPQECRQKFEAMQPDKTAFKGVGRKRLWSLTDDEIILKGCMLGKTWDAIKDELGLPRDVVISRGRRLHARQQEGALNVHAARQAPQAPAGRSDDDEALPAGHPDTWKLLMPNDEFPSPIQRAAPPPVAQKRKPLRGYNFLHLCFQ